MNIQLMPSYNPYTLKRNSVQFEGIKKQQKDNLKLTNNKKDITPVVFSLVAALGMGLNIQGCSNPNNIQSSQAPVVQKNDDLSQYSENVRKAAKLRDCLFEYEDNLSIENTKDELEKFFNENSIKNVEIEDINNPKDKNRIETLNMKKAIAAFWVESDSNFDYKKGTLYLDTKMDLSDKYSRLLFIDEVTHEVTHALQANKDTTKEGFKDYASDFDKVNSAKWFLNMGMGYYPQIMSAIESAKNGAWINFAQTNLSQEEIDDIINFQKTYPNLVNYDKEVKISDDVIKKGIVEYFNNSLSYMGYKPLKWSFEDVVNGCADFFLDAYLDNVPHKKNEETEMKKMMLSAIIYIYNCEAEAYEAGNLALKKEFGLKDTQNTLFDYIPESYRMIADVLQEKLSNY